MIKSIMPYDTFLKPNTIDWELALPRHSWVGPQLLKETGNHRIGDRQMDCCGRAPETIFPSGLHRTCMGNSTVQVKNQRSYRYVNI